MSAIDVLEGWFIPAVTPLCLTSCVYLFEELEQEKGDKLVAQIIFVAACLVLAYVAALHAQKSSRMDVRLTLLFEIIAIAIVALRIVQDPPSTQS